MTTERQLEQGNSGQGSSGAVTVPKQANITRPPDQGHTPAATALMQMRDPIGIEPSGGQLEPAVAGIPIEIDVAIPIRKFRVRNLLALAPGQVITTQWLEGEDLPLGARGAQLAWTEFEVVDHKLAVRITRPA
jgi:flagellar motor switch protein FliN/FliY